MASESTSSTPNSSTPMTIDQLRRCRLLFLDGIWKLKLPDGTIREATGQEVVAILPRLKKEGHDQAGH